MPAGDNRALIRRYYLDEVWNKGNFALVAKLIAPDCLVHDPAIAGIIGPAGVIRFVTTWRTAFSWSGPGRNCRTCTSTKCRQREPVPCVSGSPMCDCWRQMLPLGP
jgi:hypothetical protein